MKTVEDYMRLPYHVGMVRDESDDGHVGWVAWVEELRGCLSQGETPEEAATMIQEAMELWLSTAIEDGDDIPEPRPTEVHSGRFLVRMPSTLHAMLDAGARREGVSMNQYVTALLAGAVGWQGASSQPKERAAS